MNKVVPICVLISSHSLTFPQVSHIGFKSDIRLIQLEMRSANHLVNSILEMTSSFLSVLSQLVFEIPKPCKKVCNS